jgi:hypothetical protein
MMPWRRVGPPMSLPLAKTPLIAAAPMPGEPAYYEHKRKHACLITASFFFLGANNQDYLAVSNTPKPSMIRAEDGLRLQRRRQLAFFNQPASEQADLRSDRRE